MNSLVLTPIDQEIRRRIDACPKLASLQCNNRALSDLVKSDLSVTSQIAEIIRRDPSLSARLLRMVNSVYFGLSARVNNIEEAVFFLGLRQIRELSMATPVIEELESMQNSAPEPLPWRELWAHSIGTAVLTREILRATPMSIDDETDYLAGLLHNVGKVVMASAFPEELLEVTRTPHATAAEVCEHERRLHRMGSREDRGLLPGTPSAFGGNNARRQVSQRARPGTAPEAFCRRSPGGR